MCQLPSTSADPPALHMQLLPLAHEIVGQTCIRRCVIKRLQGAAATVSELWFKFDQSIPAPQDDDCDAYLLAVLMDAMKEKCDIEIQGRVSQQLLSNLVEYQAAWHKWMPKTYHQIDIRVTAYREEAPPQPGAVCAFSGGVDATFSVWRHAQAKCSHRTQQINFCSLVHGFDIPLEHTATFEKASAHARHTLSDLGIALQPIQTNHRQLSQVNWDHSYACGLVATLSNFKNAAGTCILGSSEPYNSLVMAVGSSPITDHLLSSREFVVLHDGADHSRSEKIREIVNWETGSAHLRVCYQRPATGLNCGVCEKCVRTRLIFLAMQAPIPACFPDSNILEDLKGISIRKAVLRAEWRQVYEFALKNGVQAPWLRQLPKIINRKRSLLERLQRRRGTKTSVTDSTRT